MNKIMKILCLVAVLVVIGALFGGVVSAVPSLGPVYASSSNLANKAASLAEEVVGAPYLWGGKGWDWKEGKFVDSNLVKEGYHWNWKDHNEIGKGVDCSGLVFWAYNKAAGATKYKDSSNPIQEEGASGQWMGDIEQIPNKIPTVSDLKTGDLLFLDTPPLGSIDHVGMYVGKGDILHSRGGVGVVVGVEKKTLNEWLNLPVAGKKYKDYFFGYGRVKAASGDKFNIGDIVRVTTNLNVRPEPGSSFEITNPDYPGYAPAGTIGIVLSGPSSANNFIWWVVNYGPGLYSGWSVEDWLEKVDDNRPPTVDAFSVTPDSVTLSDAFTIPYTVSDTGGSGLKQVELWRKGTGDWEQIGDPISLVGEGDGPYSTSFYDAPNSVGTYWYGIHVVDNAGNLGWEPDPPGPIEVEVTPTPTPSPSPSPTPTPTPSPTPSPTLTPTPTPTLSPSPPSALPDLVITEIHSDTIYGNVGEPIEVRVTVTNQGLDAAGFFYVDVYKNLDTPPTPVFGDVYMHVSSLPAGASTDVVLKGTYYVAGEYKLWAQVDLDKYVDESNEGNNIYGPVLVYISHPPQPPAPKPSPAPSPTPITTPSPTPIPTLQPDLIVEDIWIEPAEFGSDDTVKVWQRTKNIGDGDAVDTFRIKRYFDGTYISSYNRNGLTAGQSFTTYKTYTWPSDCNSHTIKVVVDTEDAITESNEGNNELSKTFSAVSSPTPTPTPSPTPKPSPTPSPGPTPQPDLIVDEISLSGIPLSGVFPPGDDVGLQSSVKNVGNRDAIGTFRVKTYFDGEFVGYYDVKGLATGQWYCNFIEYTWPIDCNPHTITVVVDTEDTIAESIEDNNELPKSFSAVPPPTPTLPPSPSPSPKPTPSPSPSPKPNQPPTLSSGYVTPPSGDTSTVFNYYVTYKDPDGDAPAWLVVIKGAPPGLGGLSDHTMTKISGDYKSGAVFKYSTTLPALPAGYNYQYYFYFDDGHGHTVVYPDTGMLQGPIVALPNQPPTLSNFSAGGQGQIGDFYITYTDPDGDAPTIKYVYIDGSPHTMTKISGDYVSGAKFKYSTTLSMDEEHNFYFYFEDGHAHSVRWPASETIVIPIPPPPPKP